MYRLPRLLVFVFLVVFAAESVLSVSSATAMALDMAVVDDTNKTMDGCGRCDPVGMKQDGTTCDMGCTVPAAAILSDVAVFTTPPPAAPPPSRQFGLVGRTGPPGLFPPRTTFLS